MRGGVYAALPAQEKDIYRRRATDRYQRLRRERRCPACVVGRPESRSTVYCDACYFQKYGPSRRGRCGRCRRPCNLDPGKAQLCWRCRWGK